nr:MAG TPA: hypothetical protein [Caudoviricetes sp.]
MADAFLVILPFGCETLVLTNRKSIRFFLYPYPADQGNVKTSALCNRQSISKLRRKLLAQLSTYALRYSAKSSPLTFGSTRRASSTAVSPSSP